MTTSSTHTLHTRRCPRCPEHSLYPTYPVNDLMWRFQWIYCPPCRTELRLTSLGKFRNVGALPLLTPADYHEAAMTEKYADADG